MTTAFAKPCISVFHKLLFELFTSGFILYAFGMIYKFCNFN